MIERRARRSMCRRRVRPIRRCDVGEPSRWIPPHRVATGCAHGRAIDFELVSRPCAHPETWPAERYRPCDELVVVTCYFNSSGFRTRRETYDRFAVSIRGAGLKLLTVERAFGEADFTLPSGPDCMRVRSRDVLWQKERLINLAVASLPAAAEKIAWLDCDVLFSNPDWAVQTAALLDEVPIVQLCAERPSKPGEERTWLNGAADVTVLRVVRMSWRFHRPDGSGVPLMAQ